MANAPGGGARPRRRTPAQALLYWGLVLGVWGLIFVAAFLAVFATDLPDTSHLYDVTRAPSITYLDRSGVVIAVRGSQYAPPVDLKTLPPYVPAAFIAIEDRQFYRHFGFNPWGMIRSAIWNLGHPNGPLRGGSTITQQLARNLFLTPDQTYRRKAQELVLALWLEMHFSKAQILSLYLNRVNFGGGAYGIEAAAERFFDKPASRLTLGEAALLAATMKGPSRYNPAVNSARAAARATVVLNAMYKTGAITAAQRAAAFAHPVRVAATLANQRASFFIDWLDAHVRAQFGQPTEDLVVETTLDLPIQAAAETALRRVVAEHAAQGVGEGALVALDGEGRIRAYVGGVDYQESQFDRASQASRQAGSAFKPFIYLTAMEAGRTPSDPVIDQPVTIDGWSPRNYDGRFLGPITLETALAQSINTVAAELAQSVGTANVAATAHRLGIAGRIQTDPSMALGAVEVTPLEMAAAYDAFANGGRRVAPWGIERIRTASGRILYDHGETPSVSAPVIGQPALAEMTQMLRQVLVDGTGARARVGGWDEAGKTGTTSNYKDAWFVGYTGGFVAAVWMGRDDDTPMRRVTGGGPPAEAWRDFMAAALPRLQAQPIPGGEAASPAAPGPDQTPAAPYAAVEAIGAPPRATNQPLRNPSAAFP